MKCRSQDVLRVIAERPGITRFEIARLLGVASNNVQSALRSYLLTNVVRVQKQPNPVVGKRPVNGYFPTPDLAHVLQRTRVLADPMFWQPQDVELLAAQYPHRSNGELAARMGRSTQNIEGKAARLGYRKSAEYKQTCGMRGYPPELRQVIALVGKLRRTINEKY